MKPQRAWTPDEVAKVRRYYPRMTLKQVADMLGRSVLSVNAKIYKLGLGVGRGNRSGCYTLTSRLAAAVNAGGAKGIGASEVQAIAVGKSTRTAVTTLGRLEALGLAFGVGFGQSRRYFQHEADAQAWDRVRPRSQYERKMADRAIRAQSGVKRGLHPAEWTDAEIQTLRDHYPAKGSAYVAALTGRTQGAVKHQAAKLGVKGSHALRWVDHTPAPRPASPSRSKSAAPRQGRTVTSSIARVPTAPAKRGPFLPDAPVTFHPNFKFTRAPAPPAALRTNTHPVF